MHILLVSNCEHRARNRTRQLLDRYATRVGDTTWETPITVEALDSLHRTIRKEATRQTSVACYKNHDTLEMALCWIVGNNKSYDGDGHFVVGSAKSKASFPPMLSQASLMAKFSGFIHDFGKANCQFQNKLVNSLATVPLNQKDAIRHEWLSSMLIQRCNFGTLDGTQLNSLWSDIKQLNVRALKEPSFLANPPVNAVDACTWAVATHHGAMGGGFTVINGVDASRHVDVTLPLTLNQTTKFVFQKGILNTTTAEDAKRWDNLFYAIKQTYARMAGIQQPQEFWQTSMLIARAALILADHKVSSEQFVGKREPDILFANTKQTPVAAVKFTIRRSKKTNTTRFLDQPLSWHLQQVGERAPAYVRMFDATQMPKVSSKLVNFVLAQRAPMGSRFHWQDSSADHVSELLGQKLIFNVAATGSGKTLANLKIAFAMRKHNARVMAAFNLRSLTTQTFAAFSEHIQVTNPSLFQENFACLLGETNKDATYFAKEDGESGNDSTSMSIELKECTMVPPQWLNRIAGSNKEHLNLVKLVAAPVLVSTMDWIVAAGEPGQQARHVKALLRVTTSDLILDEVDSYDVDATIAVMRVVQVAASFGRNVIVSSATLSPALVRGLSIAYEAGHHQYNATQGNKEAWHSVIVQNNEDLVPVCLCNPTASDVDLCYRETMQRVALSNAKQVPTKRFQVVPVKQHAYLNDLYDEALLMHEQWKSTPSDLKCSVSIGLVRVANVHSCVRISEFLRKRGDFVVCAYHARDISNRREYKEYWLDKVLSRSNDAWIEALKKCYPDVLTHVGELRLVVVATPVEEVGRDHDFDWAIIEPSSMHSIIQTSGRVNRHRRIPIAPEKHNIAIMDINWREYEQQGRNIQQVCFTAPGLETKTPSGTTHPQHAMQEVLKNVSGLADDILDAGLIFDSARKTFMAQYDEDAVELQSKLALPVLSKSPGFSMAHMLKDFATQYPLREKNFSYQLELRVGQELYNCLDGLKTGSWKQTSVPNNTWLTPMLNSTVLPAQLNISSHKELTISDVNITWNDVEF